MVWGSEGGALWTMLKKLLEVVVALPSTQIRMVHPIPFYCQCVLCFSVLSLCGEEVEMTEIQSIAADQWTYHCSNVISNRIIQVYELSPSLSLSLSPFLFLFLSLSSVNVIFCLFCRSLLHL